MKKLLLTLSVIAGLLSNAFAIDLISVATNGKSNENSLGVKTLNNQEMSEVGLQFSNICMVIHINILSLITTEQKIILEPEYPIQRITNYLKIIQMSLHL